MHEYSIVQSLVDSVAAAVGSTRSDACTTSTSPSASWPASTAACCTTAYEVFRAGTLCEHARADDRSHPGAMGVPALPRCRSRAAPFCAAPLCNEPAQLASRRRDRPATNRTGGGLMCQDCGCGDVEPRAARSCRRASWRATTARPRTTAQHFRERGIFAINLMGSPGSGKTAVLEATARAFDGRRRTRRDRRRSGHRQRRRAPRARRHPLARHQHRTGLPSRRGDGASRAASLSISTASSISSSRTSATSSAPPSTTSGRRQRRRALGDRGGGQAAQVPDHVRESRSRPADQNRSAAASADVDVARSTTRSRG